MKTLVIVESPAKAKTIKKYLPDGYRVEASMGHIIDLPREQMGINVEKDFKPLYITMPDKKEVAKRLKEQAKESERIFLATDPDREGEAISWHIANLLGVDLDEEVRVEFHEITKKAVSNAFEHRRKIDMDLVNSQQARRILDRLVGYKLSPFLWNKVKKGLSAGRVQSVTTRMIVDREEEIENFVPKEYWLINALLKKETEEKSFQAKFYGIDGKKTEIKTKEEADAILKKVENGQYVVQKVKQSKRQKNAPFPFTTSTLQQEANKKLGFTTKKTMMIAQQLYEGVEIEGQGLTGLITYLRTDSIRVSEEARSAALAYITAQYGKEYAMYARRKTAKKDGVQDAHEAIRPTMIELSPQSVTGSLSRDQARLYNLIYQRFLASNMKPAQYDVLTVDIACNEVLFRATGSVLVFDGYLKLYDNKTEEDQENMLPSLAEGDVLLLEKITSEQKFTLPPPRYTEASLVKALEERGIGRPSTYAATIATILNRRYVTLEEKKFKPTELGVIVTDVMKEYFKDIIDIDFTAQMESELDKISEGNVDWVELIGAFYQEFTQDLQKAEEMDKIKIPDVISGEKCEKCGSDMLVKDGRYGKFLACSAFPKCKNVKSILETIEAKCPKCGANLTKRRTKRGKIFYGCSAYPDCDYLTWSIPTKEKCEKCGSLKFKKTRAKNAKAACLVCDGEE